MDWQQIIDWIEQEDYQTTDEYIRQEWNFY